VSRPNTDHVVIGDALRLVCLHCGTRTPPVDPTVGVEIGAMAKACKAFSKLHAKCKAPSDERCAACMELGHGLFDHVRLKVLTPEQWPGCGDDGASSKAIYNHMRDKIHGGGGAAPYDPDDFGRCSRLLAASWAVGWRARMGEMTAGTWAKIAPTWEELESLWAVESKSLDGMAPRLCARLQELRGGG
jgi:hypothetical protein